MSSNVAPNSNGIEKAEGMKRVASNERIEIEKDAKIKNLEQKLAEIQKNQEIDDAIQEKARKLDLAVIGLMVFALCVIVTLLILSLIWLFTTPNETVNVQNKTTQMKSSVPQSNTEQNSDLFK